jgi:hypothetical protein
MWLSADQASSRCSPLEPLDARDTRERSIIDLIGCEGLAKKKAGRGRIQPLQLLLTLLVIGG